MDLDKVIFDVVNNSHWMWQKLWQSRKAYPFHFLLADVGTWQRLGELVKN
jgi:hypothetical protein